VAGGAYVLLIFFFGLSAGVVGKIKGSSFLLWFLIGAVLPFFGTIAALLYRFERNEPRRQCPECGHVIPLHNQVCMRCGYDLDFPSQPAISGR
jgi:ribosomal protein S27AE